jgi:hypothetical protein
MLTIEQEQRKGKIGPKLLPGGGFPASPMWFPHSYAALMVGTLPQITALLGAYNQDTSGLANTLRARECLIQFFQLSTD